MSRSGAVVKGGRRDTSMPAPSLKPSGRPRRRRRSGPLLVAALLCALPEVGAAAHEIPADVLVRILIRPEGDHLTVLVRVPLVAMRDFDWPLRGPGYLDLESAAPGIADAARVWLVDGLRMYRDGEPLPAARLRGARLSAPSDRSFGGVDRAVEHVRGPPLPASTALVPEQALLDALLEVPVGAESDGGRLSIDPGFAHLGLRTTTVLRFVAPDGGDRVYQYVGDPGLVRLDPGWHHAAARFVALGFEHILDGIDHLLFLACLLLPYRRVRPLVPIVTAFTAAHSVTLIASALGLAPTALWFPPLVETLIAASIVWMAVENAVGPRLRRRWMVAFAFGLVHGFGFSFALGESLQFAGPWLLTSLLSFNLGVEMGQLVVVALLVPVWNLARRRVAERTAAIVVAVLIGHTAWHWMTERMAELRAYRLVWPAPGAGLLATGLRWIMLALIVLAVAWALREAFARWDRRGVPSADSSA